MIPQEHYLLILALVFIFTLVFSILFNTILLRFASTLGIRENVDSISRWSASQKPALGGITFFISFLISLSFHSIFFSHFESIFNNLQALGVLATVCIAFLMGLADDAYNTRPILKFIVQALCSVVLIFTNNYIHITANEWFNYLLTFLWVVGIMNSINMLDNMDGITTAVSITIITSIFVSLKIGSDEMSLFDSLVLIGVMGSLCGFLFHNWNPSKMFMGDTGSQFIGMFLAYYGIKYLWNSADFNGETIPSKQLCTVLAAFMLPMLDTTFVTISRLMKRTSPFVGGKDHTTHHLSYLGFTDSQVAFLFVGFGGFSVFLVLVINRFIPAWNHLYTIA
ncbi:MAG TPA: MraY family glycosyltransferase, partial [Flavobacteriales bacterium]|nr:MraY family glycosyltransferase [Flavobacteriales bacterium]